MFEDLGENVLHSLVLGGNVADVEIFLAGNSSGLDIANNLGQTPLHLAAGTGSIQIVSVLLTYGANIEAIDRAGNRPVHEATLGNHFEVVKFLVERRANPDAQNLGGDSPLNLLHGSMSDQETAAIFGWLIAKGAVYTIYTAVAYGMVHVVDAMLKAQPTSWLEQPMAELSIVKACTIHDPTSNRSLLAKRRSIVRLLCEYGANPNKICGNTSPLLNAIRVQDFRIVELLIDCGADVNLEVENCSPIQKAKYYGNSKIIELLLSHGAIDDGKEGACSDIPF